MGMVTVPPLDQWPSLSRSFLLTVSTINTRSPMCPVKVLNFVEEEKGVSLSFPSPKKIPFWRSRASDRFQPTSQMVSFLIFGQKVGFEESSGPIMVFMRHLRIVKDLTRCNFFPRISPPPPPHPPR